MFKCGSCEEALGGDEIALSKKLLGRRVKSFFCIQCLADYFEKTPDELRKMIKEFRQSGCELFG